MRILMWFTVGFAAACTLGIYLGIGLWLGIIAAIAAVTLFLLKKPRLNVFATILVGVSVGMLWLGAFGQFYLNDIKQYDGEKVNVTAVISDYSFPTNYGVAADATVKLEGKNYKLRLYYPSDRKLNPGDKVTGEFRFRLTTNDALQGSTYHQGDGTFLLAYASETSVITPGTSNSFRYWGVILRRNISQMVQKVFPEKTYAFALALLLGDDNNLSYETDTDFKVSGIRHVIAVSGLHVSILMSVVYLFTGRRRFLSALIGIPVLILFAAIVGFTPSVVRACVMQGLILLAMAFNEEYDPPTALAFAVLTMLCVNPMTITSVSFQLSCGCIVGILLLYNPINEYLIRALKVPKGKSRKAKFMRGICSGITITVCTTITTTPLSAFYFGAVSVIGVITNLLTLWVIAFVFWGIAIACVVGFVYLPAAKVIAWVVSVPIGYVIIVAKYLADIPFSAVYTCSVYIVVWLVMSYALLSVFFLMKKKRPLLLVGCVVTGLILAIMLSWINPAKNDSQVTVFDVGQGQAILLEGDGRYYLVDCGGDNSTTVSDRVMHHLLARGITRLDGIVVTHYDTDHAAAIPLLLTGIDADMLYLPAVADLGGIRSQLETGKYDVYWIDKLTSWEFGKSKITIVPGVKDAKNDNESSLCILFQRENCDILITGDRTTTGEKALMKEIQLPELELLVVGHHGSKTSTDIKLLETTRPKAAVISVSKTNNHGHPSKEVLDKLKLFGCDVWRTDQDGTIIFRG